MAGGERLDYVGLGTSPEYFLVTRPGGGDFGGSRAGFAVLFTSLTTAQNLAGGEPAVNDVVISLREGPMRPRSGPSSRTPSPAAPSAPT